MTRVFSFRSIQNLLLFYSVVVVSHPNCSTVWSLTFEYKSQAHSHSSSIPFDGEFVIFCFVKFAESWLPSLTSLNTFVVYVHKIKGRKHQFPCHCNMNISINYNFYQLTLLWSWTKIFMAIVCSQCVQLWNPGFCFHLLLTVSMVLTTQHCDFHSILFSDSKNTHFKYSSFGDHVAVDLSTSLDRPRLQHMEIAANTWFRFICIFAFERDIICNLAKCSCARDCPYHLPCLPSQNGCAEWHNPNGQTNVGDSHRNSRQQEHIQKTKKNNNTKYAPGIRLFLRANV